jgi:hypothetical protein
MGLCAMMSSGGGERGFRPSDSWMKTAWLEVQRDPDITDRVHLGHFGVEIADRGLDSLSFGLSADQMICHDGQFYRKWRQQTLDSGSANGGG